MKMYVKYFYGSLCLTVILVSSSWADWKSDANTRIEQIRKRNAQITVLGASGLPVTDVNVQIVQTKKYFKFGTCLNYSDTTGNTTYQNFAVNHFNYAVCENESKWPANEPSQDSETYTQADAIYSFCQSHGIHMRGHCLFWEQTSSVPSWVTSLGCTDIQTQVNQRIDHGVAHFQNEFEQWDVDNEMLNNDFYGTCLGDQGRANMFIRANQVDPNCLLFMNEYNGNSFGGYDETSYISRVNTLRSLGATIHGIGIQAHISGGFGDSQAQQYWTSVLKPLGTLGLPIMATEFDSDTTSDATRATDLENFYRIAYSDPNVLGIVMWGFMVGHTWRASGAWGLVSSSGVLNAAGTEFESLMSEWSTNDANTTDSNGAARFRGFHGTYQITLSKVGEPNTEIYTIDIDPGTGTEEFVLNTGFANGPPETNAPTPDPMTWASVPAATGPYTITMTATTASDNSPPVKYYFECTNHGEANSTWQTSPTYVASGLSPSTLYTFRVKARDSAPTQNQTGWSSEQSATTNSPDTTPPTPNPMTWASVPTATSSTAITMTASTANDATSPPVQYYFECTNHGEANSTWQSSPTYTPSGLNPLTSYSFRAKARDSAIPTKNETGWSVIQSATTLSPEVNFIGSWVAGTTHTKETGTNRVLIFIGHGEYNGSDMNLVSVTYGGQAMTKIIDMNVGSGTSYRGYVGAFMLNEAGITAASGSTFVTSWNVTPESNSFSSAFFSNVDQAAPIRVSARNGTASSTPNPITTSALNTNSGDMVVLGATCGNNGTYTLNNSFILGINQSVGTNGHTSVTGYKRATGDAETPSATHTSVNRQMIIGFVLKAGTIDLPPAAPINLAATAGNGKVTLDWNDNNEIDLAGYNVYRSITSGSGYGKLNVSLLSDSNYVDTNVINGTTYYYVVTAVDANGNESGYSNEASAKPNYQNCNDVQAGGGGLLSDLNGDCYVDYKDLDIIAGYWLSTDCGSSNNCGGADFAPTNGTVDFFDFEVFAEQWMRCNNPQDANCVPN